TTDEAADAPGADPATDPGGRPAEPAPSCDTLATDDVTYTIWVNGTDIGPDLRVATLLPGDEVVVTGTVPADCVDALTGALAVATYAAPGAVFDPMATQALAGADVCDEDCVDPDGSFTLRHVVVSTDTCGWQVDVVLGPVLETVGPDGGYYSSTLSGGVDRLLTADNGGSDTCTV
ncbi:MAG: hypothetical protein S0880_27200, partial [Actinomycetota bacterium]|nr:hypothetical protein [Actinomycetota bacterium]